MTGDTSPLRIRASRSASEPSTSLTFGIEPNALLSAVEAGVWSRSTKPIVHARLPPEKIEPKRITKINGKARVQKSAARSRLKLLMLAMVRSSRALNGRSP
jgi:hypothetical protein